METPISASGQLEHLCREFKRLSIDDSGGKFRPYCEECLEDGLVVVSRDGGVVRYVCWPCAQKASLRAAEEKLTQASDGPPAKKLARTAPLHAPSSAAGYSRNIVRAARRTSLAHNPY